MSLGNALHQDHSLQPDGIGNHVLPERFLHTKSVNTARRVERRRAERIACCFPMHWDESLGTIYDINEFGMLFETDRPLNQAKPIKLAVLIPSTNDDGVPVIALCDAKVVRVEEPLGLYDRYLVAATFSSLKLH